ncbi:MAG: hypothetical protein DCF22_23135 [Leptolyngbya sp.]|nr:MAG: hypothetical protein DCF22_23135 [Leptolyngbya sp.]
MASQGSNSARLTQLVQAPMNPTFDDSSSQDLDQHLKQLAIAAQQQSPKSRERQRALARLINAIQRW